jgi:hypothetical protein
VLDLPARPHTSVLKRGIAVTDLSDPRRCHVSDENTLTVTHGSDRNTKRIDKHRMTTVRRTTLGSSGNVNGVLNSAGTEQSLPMIFL